MVYDFSTDTVRFANAAVDEFISDPANIGAADVAPTVLGFSFTSDDMLVASVIGKAVSGIGDNTGISTTQGIVELPANDPLFDADPLNNQVTPITLDGTPVVDFHGLEVVPGDDDFVYGISSLPGTPSILHVKVTAPGAGIAANYGPLPDPDDNRAVPRGENLGDLDWNPVLPSFYLNNDGIPADRTRKGILISEDTATDELVIVDDRDRFPATNLFSIIGFNTTSTTSISIAQVPTFDKTNPTAPRPMEPTTGGPITIQGINSQTGVNVPAEPPPASAAGVGSVLIGARYHRRRSKRHSRGDGSESAHPPNPQKALADFWPGSQEHEIHLCRHHDQRRCPQRFDRRHRHRQCRGERQRRPALRRVVAHRRRRWSPRDGALKDKAAGTDLIGNIFVEGDLRDFESDSDIGGTAAVISGTTDPASAPYLSGLNMAIGGNLGQIHTTEEFLGNVRVSGTFAGSSENQNEVEDRRGDPRDTITGDTYFQGFDGEAPSLGDLAFGADFSNDTFATAQYLGTASNGAFSGQAIVVTGEITNEPPTIVDPDDYYRVSLLAGQTVTVQLQSSSGGGTFGADVGVFDPDDRLIDSDRSQQSLNSTVRNALANQPFQFTATEPGDYRFAVGVNGDAEFNGANVEFTPITYTLSITGEAQISLGGIHAGTDLFTYETGLPGIGVHKGDLGGLTADNDVVSNGTGPSLSDRQRQFAIDRRRGHRIRQYNHSRRQRWH